MSRGRTRRSRGPILLICGGTLMLIAASLLVGGLAKTSRLRDHIRPDHLIWIAFGGIIAGVALMLLAAISWVRREHKLTRRWNIRQRFWDYPTETLRRWRP